MEKRYKTDYFEKIKLLASICNSNISDAKKIISSEKLTSDSKPDTAKNILYDIRNNLEKDYFAPFEREDIFMLSEKLCELSKNSHLLCIYASEADFFGFPATIVSLTECLKNISNSVLCIFEQLTKYPKQGDLKPVFENAESLQYDFRKLLYDCMKRIRNDGYHHILHLTEKCADNCKEIVQLTQYTLIKNS